MRDPFFQELGPKTFSLLAKLDHQIGALDALRKAGIILDFGGNHQLAARRGLLFSIGRRIN